MRERLIWLLKEANDIVKRNGFDFNALVMADHLLANGVIVPKVKVGQTIYRCDFIANKVIDWTVVRIDVYEDEIVYCDDSYNVFTDDEIGVREDVFLTREEAEQALKGGAKE